jgi:cell pole-organizing protein PopZ
VKSGKVETKTVQPPRPAPKPDEAELELAAPEKPKSTPQEMEVEQMPSPTPGMDHEQDSLVSAEVSAASAAALSKLVSNRAHAAVELATPGQGLLVETLVRQAVEPVLRDWLDNNLQAIVERLVRREIERISRRAELG